MTLNPATWPVGILPIAFFVLGIVALVDILFRGKNPTNLTLGIFMGFVPSVLVVIAWFVGYRLPSDHALWKFVTLSAIGGVMWMPLRFHVLARAELGEEMKSKVRAFSKFQLWRNLVFAIAVILLICGIFALMQSRFKNPHDCTRLMCEVGATYLGSQYSSLGTLWFFTLLPAMALMGAVVTLVALLKKYR